MVHTIDHDSPLWGMTREEFMALGEREFATAGWDSLLGGAGG